MISNGSSKAIVRLLRIGGTLQAINRKKLQIQ